MTTRRDIAFDSHGTMCAGWLYLPDGASPEAPRPVVVMAHGVGGIKEMRLDAFAERFAAAGYICVVFDYRHLGASDGQPRQLIDIGKQRADYHAAIRYARSLPEIDPDKVVVWGTSYSGGHVMVVASEDHRVAAVVSQCPFTDGLASSLALPVFTSLKVGVRAFADLALSLVGKGPVNVPLAAEPGGTAFMVATDAKPGYTALVPADLSFRNEAAARFALALMFDRPGASAKKVTAPMYVVVCQNDTVAPAKATLKHLAKAPSAEVVVDPAGHFDIYVGDDFERVVADEVDFLARRVPIA